MIKAEMEEAGKVGLTIRGGLGDIMEEMKFMINGLTEFVLAGAGNSDKVDEYVKVFLGRYMTEGLSKIYAADRELLNKITKALFDDDYLEELGEEAFTEEDDEDDAEPFDDDDESDPDSILWDEADGTRVAEEQNGEYDWDPVEDPDPEVVKQISWGKFYKEQAEKRKAEEDEMIRKMGGDGNG